MTRPDLQKKIEGLKTANRRVLYTDTINGGKQAMRDDLWAVSTEEVEAILSAVDEYVAWVIGTNEEPDTQKLKGPEKSKKREYEPAYSLRATVINQRLAEQRQRAGLEKSK